MKCLITERLSRNTHDANHLVILLRRKMMFSSDIRERMLINNQINELENLISSNGLFTSKNNTNEKINAAGSYQHIR